MYFGKFYENRLSFTERSFKLFLETVTFVAIKERVTESHNYNRNSHVHNALQKIAPA